MEGLRRDRKASISAPHQIDLPSQAGQREWACDDFRQVEVEQGQCWDNADTETRAHKTHDCGELFDLNQGLHDLRAQSCLEVLAHAACSSQMYERPGGQIADGDRTTAGKWMIYSK